MTIYTVDCGFKTPSGNTLASECGLEFWNLLSVLQTGAIDVTDKTGTEVSGLSIGHCYAIEAYNGPYDVYDGGLYDDGGSPYTVDFYSYVLSLDGSSWVGNKRNGYENYVNHSSVSGEYWRINPPTWALHAEWVSNSKIYVRTYWVATTTSVWIGVCDSEDYFGDNTGSLSYRLWDCGEVHTVGCRLG